MLGSGGGPDPAVLSQHTPLPTRQAANQARLSGAQKAAPSLLLSQPEKVHGLRPAASTELRLCFSPPPPHPPTPGLLLLRGEPCSLCFQASWPHSLLLPPGPGAAPGSWPTGGPRDHRGRPAPTLLAVPPLFPHSPTQAAPLLAHGVSFCTESRLLGVGPGRHTRGTPCCLSKHWADWFLVGPMRSQADGGLSGMLLGGSIRNPQHSLLGHFCHPM